MVTGSIFVTSLFLECALHEMWPLVFYSEEEIPDDNPESQEMLEEQLVRMLTREVMDLMSK